MSLPLSGADTGPEGKHAVSPSSGTADPVEQGDAGWGQGMDRAARSWWGLHVAWPVTALATSPAGLNLPPRAAPWTGPQTDSRSCRRALLAQVLAAGHAICAAGPLFL